jgi:hypothetical protein
MRLSLVSKIQPLEPTNGSQVSSSVPGEKWAKCRSKRTASLVKESRIARVLQRFSSR